MESINWQGCVCYDGRDLSTRDLRLVRLQIGSVLQQSRLLPGDIASNIPGAATLTVDDAWEVVCQAGMAEGIERLPMGMHTIIGDGIDTLSGGQRSASLSPGRPCIGRASCSSTRQ